MIFKNKQIALVLGLMMLTVTACDISDTNKDPNRATDTGINNLLPHAQVNLAYGIGGDISQYNSILVQQTAGIARQHAQVARYNLDIVGIVWDRNLYAGSMNDLNILIQKATEAEAWHHRGVAKILMANALGQVTSLWGDAPFSEAFQGAANTQPRFDSSQDLYARVQTLLTEGKEDLARTVSAANRLGASDLIYNGNIARWTAAANALSARYHNHLSKVNPQASAQNVLNALGAGTISSSAEDMRFQFGSTASNANPWHNHKTSSFNDTYMGKHFIDLLKDLNDPRLPVYATTNSSGEYVGQVAGIGSAQGISDIGSTFLAANAPFYYITYIEVKFLEAEANLRLGNYGAAASAMNTAIIASLTRVNGSANPDYVAAHASETAASMQNGGLERLMTQKYIAMFLQPEAFTDWRRTGIPQLTPAVDNQTNNIIPRRWPYPNSERSNNSANTPVVSITDRLWWDLP